MREKPAHPSKEQLRAFNLGQLSLAEADFVEDHIHRCRPRSKIFVEMVPEDPFVRLLKETIQLPSSQTLQHETYSAHYLPNNEGIPPSLANHPRYEIIGLIGKGGMGDVYKARHLMMDRTVALKIINRELVRKAEVVNRFHREVKAAAQLSHPNIVTAHDAEHFGDVHLMVMEYVDGVNLSEKIKELGSMSIDEACEVIRQVANGLQHAHEQGLVHRDIKPHNLMVTEDGTVKILDFGLASLAPVAAAVVDTPENSGELTMAGAIMGTPDFISPEQVIDARQADIRSDIYSLGSTLYFLLTGKAPFAELSIKEKLESHASINPKPLRLVSDEVSSELSAVVEKMMSKNANDRFQSPHEVVKALAPFAVGSPNSRFATNEVQNSARSKVESKPVLAGLIRAVWAIGLTAVIAMAGFIGFLVMFSEDEETKAYRALREYLATGNDSNRPINQVDALLKSDLGHDYLRQLDDEFQSIAFFKGMFERDEKAAIAIVTQDSKIPNGQQLIIRTQGENQYGGSETTIPSDQVSVNEIQIGNGEFDHRQVNYRVTVLRNPEPAGISDVFKLLPGATYEFGVKLSDVVDARYDWQTPWRYAAHVTTGRSAVNPFLRIFNVDTQSASLGNEVRRSWKLSGHQIGELTIRLIHIANGESNIANETVLDCTELKEPLQTGEIILRIEDHPEDKVSLTLRAIIDNLPPQYRKARSSPLLIEKEFGQPNMLFARKWNGQRQKPDNTTILHRLVLLPDEKDWQPILRSIESMLNASKKGHEFVVVTLDWKHLNKVDLDAQ